jgi:CRISPR-associated protein Csm5
VTTYQLTLTTRSFLHIGDGQELHQDFDYAVFNGRTYRLNEDAILEDRGEAALARGRVPPPGRLLEPNDFQQGHYFRYILPGEPRSEKTYAMVRSCIKDVHDRPYIPGSSLKGALRTALAWAAWGEMGLSWRLDGLDNRAKFASQPLEKRIFGRDPNHDLLRALRVSDLHGPQRPEDSLALANVQVVTHGGRGSPVELEVIRPKTVFTGTLSVDDYLLGQAAGRLGFDGKQHWLSEMMLRVQRHSRQRLEQLSQWYQAAPECEKVQGFLQELARFAERFVFLQLGWGAGWDSKTFGSRLQENPGQFEALIADRRYRLQPVRGRNKPGRRAGDPFPESRKVIISQDRPVAPLGWVMLEMRAS